jgi:hypothetical protein
LTEEATSDSVPDPIYPDKGIRDADLKSVNDRKDTYHEVVEFADTLGAPIVHALRGKPFNPYDVGIPPRQNTCRSIRIGEPRGR